MSKPPFVFGLIIVLCLILRWLFQTNWDIVDLTEDVNSGGKDGTDVL